MSAASAERVEPLTFVDTNILLYAHDRAAGPKHAAAKDLLSRLWRARSGVVSTQVLQEFYVNVTRKLPDPLGREAARNVIRAYARWPVQGIGVVEILEAAVLGEVHKLSFWDSLVIVAAQRSGAHRLWTEDLQDGREFDSLVVQNPLA